MEKSAFRNIYKYLAAIILVMILANQGAGAYVCKYKEDFYKLYHVHYQQLPDDCMENIYWLEKAVKADFANPYYALAKIEDERQWEKYRYLFMMHVNLKLIEQHLRLGRIYDKKIAYFYDAPWTDEYQRNLEKAQSCYEAGYYYWEEAKLWAEKASVSKFNFLCMTDIQNWEDERERINTGDLDYGRTLDRELTRLRKVLADLIEMNEKKY